MQANFPQSLERHLNAARLPRSYHHDEGCYSFESGVNAPLSLGLGGALQNSLRVRTIASKDRGPKIEYKFVVPKLFGHPQDIPGYPAKMFGFLGFSKGHTKLFDTPPLHVEIPTPPEDIETQSSSLSPLSLPEKELPQGNREPTFLPRAFRVSCSATSVPHPNMFKTISGH